MLESPITLTGDQAKQAKNAFLSMLDPWTSISNNNPINISYSRAREVSENLITTGIFSSIEHFKNFQGTGDGIIKDVNEGRVVHSSF